MARGLHETARLGWRIASGLTRALALAVCLLVPWQGGLRAASAAQGAESSPPPAWSMIQRTAPRLALDAPELAKLPAGAGLFRNIGGATEDRLRWGSLEAAETPFVELVLRHRAGQPPATLFVALARLAASDGSALLHLAAPAGFTAKFGGFAVATAWLASDRTERPCLVFRHEDRGADLEIAGWYCGAEGSEPEPQTLACLINRLSLTDAVDDPGLKRIFAAAAERPAGCPSSPPETVTGGIAAPGAATVRKTESRKAGSPNTKARKAKPHKPKAHKARSRH
jgi:hypothetical protein